MWRNMWRHSIALGIFTATHQRNASLSGKWNKERWIFLSRDKEQGTSRSESQSVVIFICKPNSPSWLVPPLPGQSSSGRSRLSKTNKTEPDFSLKVKPRTQSLTSQTYSFLRSDNNGHAKNCILSSPQNQRPKLADPIVRLKYRECVCVIVCVYVMGHDKRLYVTWTLERKGLSLSAFHPPFSSSPNQPLVLIDSFCLPFICNQLLRRVVNWIGWCLSLLSLDG